ncbi:MAG: sensor histidine kinase [Angustibacter sp.]
MPSLPELVQGRTDLHAEDVEWLRLLVGDWQLLSDLSFADLVLWVAVSDGWLAVGHVRPTTGATVFVEDVVGGVIPAHHRPEIDEAAQRTPSSPQPPMHTDADHRSREQAVPVVHRGQVIAVLTRHTDLATTRVPSSLELTYLECADLLIAMVSSGQFPQRGAPTGTRRGAPRVGDGLVRLDVSGVVRYASPNAVSAFHRLGRGQPLTGQSLAEITTPLLRRRGAVDESLPLVLLGKAPWRVDVEGSSATLSLRAIPLLRSQDRIGALLLVRDVTELRRSEQELLSKDAIIREIHHRVKNNLQTVAALLRLQSRRVDGGGGGGGGDGRAQAALAQAERRVEAIALVHEALSSSHEAVVDFGEVARRGLPPLVEVARSAEHPVRATVRGTFGRLRAEDATALSLILSELVQNAVEHGMRERAGTVSVRAERTAEGTDEDRLIVEVTDDGHGLPESSVEVGSSSRPPSGGLGSQIVQSLASELRGTVTWSTRPAGGTVVVLDAAPRNCD